MQSKHTPEVAPQVTQEVDFNAQITRNCGGKS